VILNSIFYYLNFILDNHDYGMNIIWNFTPIIIIITLGEFTKYKNDMRNVLLLVMITISYSWVMYLDNTTPFNPMYVVPVSIYLFLKGYNWIPRLLLSYSCAIVCRTINDLISFGNGLTISKCDHTIYKNFHYCSSSSGSCLCYNQTSDAVHDFMLYKRSITYGCCLLVAMAIRVMAKGRLVSTTSNNSATSTQSGDDYMELQCE
jgi:hypothetical protein